MDRYYLQSVAKSEAAKDNLIAAAPDLLEACRKALHLIEKNNNEQTVHLSEYFDLLLDLSKAIAKAEGRHE